MANIKIKSRLLENTKTKYARRKSRQSANGAVREKPKRTESIQSKCFINIYIHIVRMCERVWVYCVHMFILMVYTLINCAIWRNHRYKREAQRSAAYIGLCVCATMTKQNKIIKTKRITWKCVFLLLGRILKSLSLSLFWCFVSFSFVSVFYEKLVNVRLRINGTHHESSGFRS